MVTGERAWELKRGVTQIKDNMSLRGCPKKKRKDNVRSRWLCSKKRFLKEELKNDHTRELLFEGAVNWLLLFWMENDIKNISLIGHQGCDTQA